MIRLPLTTDDGRTDDRAVSEVLGAILIFALLLILVVFVQVAAVPALNQQVEFNHNQRVQGDMQELGDHVEYTAATGAEMSTSVEMGVYYPTRIFLLNPPPAAGTLRTSATQLIVANARVTTNAETRDYWNGDTRRFTSRRLTYSPDYNEYRSAPNTVYEGWTMFNDHPNNPRDTALDETSPINGKRIRFVTLDGSRSESSVSAITVTTRPISVPEQTVAITNTTDPIRLTFDTALSEEEWTEILASELCADANGDFVCDDPTSQGHVVQAIVTGGQLEVVLEKGETYELRLSKVGIGTQVTQEPPHYMTSVDAPRVVDPGGTQLTVQVRDELNAAKPGVDVNWAVTGGQAALSESTVTTNERGEASVRVTPMQGPVTVVAEADLDGDGTIQERERVRFANLPISDRARDDASDINPNYDDGVILERALIQGPQAQKYVDVALQNTDPDTTRRIEAIRLNFYYLDSQGAAGVNEVIHADVSDAGAAGSVRLPVRGKYVTAPNLDTIPGSQSRTYRFRFTATNNRGNTVAYSPVEGDFFVVSIVWDDGTTSRYFIAPQEPGR